MKIKGIIFDLDGTVLDTIEDIGDSMNEVLEGLGMEKLSYNEYKLKVGRGFRNLVKDIIPNSSEEEIDSNYEALELAYERNYLNKSKPYEYIVKMLNSLVDKDIKIGINTNKNQKYASNLIAEKFENISFIDIVGVEDGRYIKPDPTSGNNIIEKMGLSKDEVLYIGDTEVDIKTGKNIGVKTVAVAWGFRNFEDLKIENPDFMIENPMEIIDLL